MKKAIALSPAPQANDRSDAAANSHVAILIVWPRTVADLLATLGLLRKEQYPTGKGPPMDLYAPNAEAEAAFKTAIFDVARRMTTGGAA